MKKLLLLTLMLPALFFTSVSQERNMWLTGTVQLSGTDYNASSETSLILMPDVGYYIDGPWAVGGRFGFETDWTSNEVTVRESRTAIVPFVRYLVGDPENMNFFLQAELPINFYGGEVNGTSMDSSTSVGFNFRPGLFYGFTPRWGVTMLMPSFITAETHNDVTTYRLGINDGYTIQRYLLSTAFGITYRF